MKIDEQRHGIDDGVEAIHQPSMVLDELFNRVSVIRRQLLEINSKSQDLDAYNTARGEVVLSFLKELLLEANRFDKVFKTEKGSIYFVLFSGETLRFKISGGKNIFGLNNPLDPVIPIFTLSPITGKVFFVDSETLHEFNHMLKITDDWRNKRIKTTDIVIGSHPIELNILEKDGNKISFVDYGDSFELIGGTLDPEDLPMGNIHTGHQISEIISRM